MLRRQTLITMHGHIHASSSRTSAAAVFACDRGSYDPQKSASADSKNGSQLRSEVTATPPTRGALKPATWGDYHIAAGLRPIDLGRSCAGAPPATFVANAAPLFPGQAV